MTDRERLIEILKKPIYVLEGVDVDIAVADYLLDNGVIVPPCKVGDTVFRVVELLNGNRLVVEGIALEYTETFESGTTKKRFYFWAKGEEFTRRHYSLWCDLTDFGKTVFLTREEAEKALSERSVSK